MRQIKYKTNSASQGKDKLQNIFKIITFLLTSASVG